MDGVICAAAALTAVRIEPRVRDYILPSHVSAEPAGKLLCAALGMTPVLRADMRLGEGTGAVALFPLLDMAAAVYHRAATFADIAVDAYRREPC
jgi:nicotinate-nucleotide--dimethylbenzimidazole phosphoribosyltransferase